MPFAIRQGDKFACIALNSASVDRELFGNEISLPKNRWFLFGNPIELNETWQSWLGTLRCEAFHRSNLCIFALASSAQPEILHDENKVLSQDVLRLFYALLLNGMPQYDGGMLLTGANSHGTPEPRSVSKLEAHLRPSGVRPFRYMRAHFAESGTLADRLEDMLNDERRYTRLKRGLHALRTGMTELWADNRLHQFVRATEAIVKPPTGRSRQLFAHRSQLLIGNTDEMRELAGELYDLRSCAEHMNLLENALGNYPPEQFESTGQKRSFQSQLIACYAYKKLAMNENLRRLFVDDHAIDAFWESEWIEQRRQWGDPLDISAAVNDHWLAPPD